VENHDALPKNVIPLPPKQGAQTSNELDRELARLDAAILAEGARLNQLEAADETRRIEKIKCRIRFADLLEERLAIPECKKTEYVKSIAARCGFGWRKAYDCTYYRYLYRDHGLSFARLAKMSVAEVRAEYGRLSGNGQDDPFSKRLKAEENARLSGSWSLRSQRHDLCRPPEVL
jgi:hypothetical protein